ncbi:MAG TPA: 4Fe-4S single cluster domain-containing protein, partial [Vicinamibacteria bacterium]
ERIACVRGDPDEATLRVGARAPVTRAEGPGARYALWLQGCSIRCPGCCNPHLFEDVGGTLVAVSALLGEMARLGGEIEGLTLLGGEPFEQAEGLVPLAQGARGLGLSMMAFSGYTLEELRTQGTTRPAVSDLLATLDVLVDGRYDHSRPESERLWAGSTNQRFHYLTDRYPPRIEHPAPGEPLRSVEVQVGVSGRWAANGWPSLSR